MRKPRIVITVALLLGLTPLLVAQSSWEGSAVVARFGEFPPGGLYAASNTFPLNSMVDVTNPDTGRSARLIIANRLEDSGVFLLLSETAADELGIARGSSASVRAEPVQLPGLTAVEPNQDLPFSPDPDVNPAASLGDPNTPIINPAAIRAAEAEEMEPATIPDEPVSPPIDERQPSAPVAAVVPVEDPVTEESSDAEETPPHEDAPEVETHPETTEVPEPSIAAVVAVEPEEEPEEPTEEPAVVQPQLEDLESPDQIADAPSGDEVIGVAPEPPVDPVRATTLDRPESPSPNVYPEARPALVVELTAPPDPAEDEAIEIVAPAPEIPAPIEEDIDVPEEPAVDPLAERLAAIERFMADQRVSSAPLEAEPLETLDGGVPVAPSGAVTALPEVDPDVAFDADVSDPLPPIPNPVRLSVILPEAVDTLAPDVTSDVPAQPEERATEIALPLAPVLEDEVEIAAEAPEPPIPGENVIALPLVPLREDVEISERLAEGPQDEEEIDIALTEPSPDREDRVLDIEPESEPEPEPDPGAEALRPTLIPEDAVISLEPADYRSPEPPQPTTEDLPARAGEEEEVVDADLAEAPMPEDAAVAMVEPVEERPREERPETPPEETVAPAVAITRGEDGAWAAANLPLVASLERNSVYVQVAAYENPRSAKLTIERLGDRFPVAVLSDGGDREFYRVFVGPLNEDEKGSALYQIRNRGFRDAFLRQP